MDRYVTLAAPTQAVFAYLADPVRLGDWLPQIIRVSTGPQALIGMGSAFIVTVRGAGGEQDIDAEIAAYEPPWLVAYRLMVAASPVLIRATCTANADGTRVHVQQTLDATPLLIDLTRLPRGLAGTEGGPG